MSNFSSEFIDALLKWIKTLGADGSLEGVCSGRGIALCLNRIDSRFFSKDWLEETQRVNEGEDFRVKASNLRKVIRKLGDYYDEVLKRNLRESEKWTVDPRKIAEFEDRTHVEKLLVLVFCTATLGPRSNGFVEQLSGLQLKQPVQRELMAVITEINTDMPPYMPIQETVQLSETREYSHERTLSELEKENSRFNTRIEEYKIEVQSLTKDKQDLISQLNEANRRIVDLDVALQEALSYKNSVGTLKERIHQLEDHGYQKEIEYQKLMNEMSHCKELIFKFENSQTDKLIDHLKEENLELSTQLQILNERLEAAEMNASENDGLRLRLKEVNTLRSENKVLKEKLETYITTAVALEDEKRINEVLKMQFEQHKLNTSDLEMRLTSETVKAEQIMYDLVKAQRKLEEMEYEKNELLMEQVRLRSEIRSQSPPSLEHDLEMSGHNASTLEPLHVDERIELKMESERLRLSIEELKKEHSQEKEKLERKILEMNAELRISKEKIAQLESEANNARQLYESSKASVDDRINSEQMSVTVVRLERELKDASKSVETFQTLIDGLKNELVTKTEELQSSKSTYLDYLEKARIAITEMEAATGCSLHSPSDYAKMENELRAKERKINQLTEQLDTSRVLNEQEQRLLTTSCYKMFSERSFNHCTSGASTSSSADASMECPHVHQQKWSSSCASTR
uniref:HOOK_N domain-containing protein n=1 Tax=Steinernema glaseri TaxID=37863 RepID=A0A1I7ZEI3_9BILA